VDQLAKGELRKSLRSEFGAFLFQGEVADKKVSVLSGGERTRLALCQLLLSPSNFLILDEPTNHLDIQSKEVLKNALKSYEGTFVVVSHDREFLEGLTNRIWEIEDQKLRIHHFGVKEFLKRKSEQQIAKPAVKEAVKVETDAPSKPALSYHEEKELKRLKNKLKNQANKSEQEIDRLEKKIAEMDAVIASLDYEDQDKANKILADYESVKKEYDTQMLLWEEATEGLMEIDEQD
jgi:ATP-binding cassette subfamily F protein 3